MKKLALAFLFNLMGFNIQSIWPLIFPMIQGLVVPASREKVSK